MWEIVVQKFRSLHKVKVCEQTNIIITRNYYLSAIQRTCVVFSCKTISISFGWFFFLLFFKLIEKDRKNYLRNVIFFRFKIVLIYYNLTLNLHLLKIIVQNMVFIFNYILYVHTYKMVEYFASYIDNMVFKTLWELYKV